MEDTCITFEGALPKIGLMVKILSRNSLLVVEEMTKASSVVELVEG